MNSKIDQYTKILLIFPAGAILFFILGGWKLAVAYMLIWIDKILLGFFYTKTGVDVIFYIEFITITTILVGLHYPPIPAFLFMLLVPLVLNSVKQLIKPSDTGGAFLLPSFNNFVDGILAAVVHSMKGQGLLIIMLIVQAIKHPSCLLYERIANPDKPPEIRIIFQIIFNFWLALYLQDMTVFSPL